MRTNHDGFEIQYGRSVGGLALDITEAQDPKSVDICVLFKLAAQAVILPKRQFTRWRVGLVLAQLRSPLLVIFNVMEHFDGESISGY